jgi:hypothetical protein
MGFYLLPPTSYLLPPTSYLLTCFRAALWSDCDVKSG